MDAGSDQARYQRLKTETYRACKALLHEILFIHLEMII